MESHGRRGQCPVWSSNARQKLGHLYPLDTFGLTLRLDAITNLNHLHADNIVGTFLTADISFSHYLHILGQL